MVSSMSRCRVTLTAALFLRAREPNDAGVGGRGHATDAWWSPGVEGRSEWPPQADQFRKRHTMLFDRLVDQIDEPRSGSLGDWTV